MRIEKTFIISLPHRLDRLIPLIDYLKSIDMSYWVVEAIKKDNGAEGLVLTIEKLFKQCIDKGYSNVVVLEDDCRFITNPIETINACFEQIPKDFDCLFLGCNLWQKHIYKYSPNLIQLSDAYALHSVIYSFKGMQKIVLAIEKMKEITPLDVLIKDKIFPDGKSFCTFPILTYQCEGFSDIEKKMVNYKNILQDRFAEKTAHL